MRQLKITKQLTNRETASLEKYFQEIGKVDLITANMEVELAQRIREGDHLTRERVRQIKEKSLRRLKSLSRSKILKTYLG